MGIKVITISEVKEGMVLARTITNDKGMLLCAEGATLSMMLIKRIERMGIESIFVQSSDQMSDDEYKAQKAELERRFAFIEDDPTLSILKEVLVERLEAKMR